MRYNFSDPGEFAKLEELAIDGQLDYSGFPCEEYRYFSQITKLGYFNRHKGWTKEICEQKQAEYRKQYENACEERDSWFHHAKLVQGRLLRTTTLAHDLNFAQEKDEALTLALQLVENLLEEPGLAKRIQNNIKEKNT